MVQRQVVGRGVGRRTFLSGVGGAVGTAAVSGVVAAIDDGYDEVVDIVEAGADPTGEEPIDDVFDAVAGDDTLIEFPSGRYKVNQLNLYGRSNFGMVGVDDDVVLVADEDHGEDYWIAGSNTRDLRFENFVLDHTADGVDPSVEFGTHDGLVVRDVEKRGRHEGENAAFGFRTYDEWSDAHVENLQLSDGSDPVGPVGIYADGDGTITFKNCQVEGFGNNGLYASWADGAVLVEGGVYKNNDRAQVRLGSAGSYVDDADVVVDDPHGGEPNVGVRISDAPGPVTVSNCEISMTAGRGSGGIAAVDGSGTFVVEDSRIHIGSGYTTNLSGGTRTAPGIFVESAPDVDGLSHEIVSTSITGGEDYYPAILSYRDNLSVRGACIEWGGPNGIECYGDGNEVVDSTITADDSTVVGDAAVSNVSTGGSCPAPSLGGGGSNGDSSGVLADAPIPPNASELPYPVMGTSSDNPTLTVYGNFVYPNTKTFALGNLRDILATYVEPGHLNVEFRSIAYPDDHRLNSVPGEERLAQLALGVWDQNDWDVYWRFFEYLFENQGEFDWRTYDDASALLARNGVRNYGWIPALAGDDMWSDELLESRIDAFEAGLEFVPQVELGGDLASATWNTEKLLDWIGRRI